MPNKGKLDVPRQIERTYVLWQNRKLSYFAGCDYFRLASHPAVLAAVKEGLDAYGLNVAASRLTTGNHPLYHRLETALAEFFAAPSALLTATGYAADLVAAQALDGPFSHVLLDARAHASLRDATRFFTCPVLEFKHCDVRDLSRRLRRLRGRARPILLTEGVFAHNGEMAPLAQYLEALPANGQILLDDAHGAGVLGAAGRGSAEYAGVPRRRLVQTVTLSKAFGVYGGAVLCDPALRERIIRRSTLFGGATPLPLPLANAALASIAILRGDQGLRRRLSHSIDYVKSALRSMGLAVPLTPTPIFAVSPRRASEAESIRRGLLAHGVFPSFIRYPGGLSRGYFRFAISSEHSRGQLDDLLAGLKISL